jgi:phage tail-like protein
MADTLKDPLVSAWFGIEFQGAVVGAFRECTGLGSENAVVEEKATGPKGLYVLKKIPGRLKYNNITLKRGLTDSIDMWTWRKQVEQGDIEAARKSGSVVMYDQKSNEIARWNFINAWPCKLTGPSGNAGTNEVAVEELEITVESYERVK